MSDTADIAAIFAKTRFNGDGIITEGSSDDADVKVVIAAAVAAMGGVADRSGAMGVNAEMIEGFYKALADYAAWCDAAVDAPFADKTDAAIAAYNALDAKVKDFFMRSKLAAFSPESVASLDVQTAGIQAISAENLTGKMAEIAAYPIARVTGKAEIDLSEPVNPAWAAQFELVKSVAFADKKVLTEADWAAVGAAFAAYTAWKGAKAGAAVEALGLETVKKFLAEDKKAALLELVAQDAALSEEAANIEMVDKFLHILRAFYRLLRNFVTLSDFYTKDKGVAAIFQSGRLIIDQRECRFCMQVADAAKHNASAAASGMFLVYCDCTTKSKPGKLAIVAAVTVGEIGDLVAGKNAIYYDNSGLEWDAVITKVVDNPISIAQSFWSPYRRMATAVENLINKSAADKDAKIMADATAKINAAPASRENDLILVDLDSASIPQKAGKSTRIVGFTRHFEVSALDAKRRCSMILHRPFQMRVLREEVASIGIDAEEREQGRGDQNTLAISLEGNVLTLGEMTLTLRPKEATVMSALLAKRGAAVSREKLSSLLGESSTNKTDVHVCYLRRKIATVTDRPIIKTVRGKGYIID